jgi:hypothetical protein
LVLATVEGDLPVLPMNRQSVALEQLIALTSSRLGFKVESTDHDAPPSPLTATTAESPAVDSPDA